MNVPAVISIRCHYCSEFHHPGDMMEIGESIQICHQCFEKHAKNVEALEDPGECQECHTPTEVLAAGQPGDSFKMYAHWKDGTYQLLCKECSEKYAQKRRDLYGPTRFGSENKIA